MSNPIMEAFERIKQEEPQARFIFIDEEIKAGDMYWNWFKGFTPCEGERPSWDDEPSIGTKRLPCFSVIRLREKP